MTHVVCFRIMVQVLTGIGDLLVGRYLQWSSQAARTRRARERVREPFLLNRTTQFSVAVSDTLEMQRVQTGLCDTEQIQCS